MNENNVPTNQEQVNNENVDTTVVDTNVELEKAIKSARSKAQNEILKSLGITSVEQGKELLEKGNQVDELLPYRERFETLTNEHNELLNELNTLREGYVFNEASVKLLAQGFNPERLDSIKPLLQGDGTIEEKVGRIRESLPELFLDHKRFSTTTPQRGNNEAITEAERYFQTRKK